MPVETALWGIAALLGSAVLGTALHRSRLAGRMVYVVCLLVCLIILVVACRQLLADPGSTPGVRLPVGLPWIGAHFRMDALSALFLGIINLGGAAASLFALGYGQHEKSPGRVLPFYPAFLAGMNLGPIRVACRHRRGRTVSPGVERRRRQRRPDAHAPGPAD